MPWFNCGTYYGQNQTPPAPAPEPVVFEYTGTMQTYTVPETGVYILEAWGAQGGEASGAYSGTYGTVAGGKGGYSRGEVNLIAGQTICIGVGGMGTNAQGSEGTIITAYGGFNGGGNGRNNYGDQYWGVASGGGATHFSKTNTLLYATDVSNLYLVAGGGGGGIIDTWTPTRYYPGDGGGLEGTGTSPGTQSTAGNGGGRGNGGSSPSYSYQDGWPCSGGGGGYYGGGYGNYTTGYGASGGSGYIDGVTNGSTTAGQRTGNGMAKISPNW